MIMSPHGLLVFGPLLAEGRSLDALIYGILTMFAAANLPALLGGLALWLGRPRDLWAVIAFVLGVCSIIPAIYALRFLWTEGGAALLFYAVAASPLLLGLGVCAWACRVLATAK